MRPTGPFLVILTQTIEREFDETDVRITMPMMESDITTLARVGQKNPSSVKTMRPELAPEVGMRLEVYENDQKLSGGIKMVYEFPNVKRSGFEKTATANERATKRITMTGDTFTITGSL